MRTFSSRVLRRFRRNEEGSIAVEAVLIFPLLVWAYLATFVYFDAFRAQLTSAKATYTISDILSREKDAITPDYLSAIWRLQKFLTTSNREPRMRLTEIRFNGPENKHEVIWSQVRGTVPVMTEARLANYVGQIPEMPDNEYMMIVETWVAYEPIFTMGLQAFVIQNFVVTRQRFAPKLCWAPAANYTQAELVC